MSHEIPHIRHLLSFTRLNVQFMSIVTVYNIFIGCVCFLHTLSVALFFSFDSPAQPSMRRGDRAAVCRPCSQPSGAGSSGRRALERLASLVGGSRDVGTRFGAQGSEQQHCRLAAHSLVVLTLSPSATTLALWTRS
jgi:hypothetical protein